MRGGGCWCSMCKLQCACCSDEWLLGCHSSCMTPGGPPLLFHASSAPGCVPLWLLDMCMDSGPQASRSGDCQQACIWIPESTSLCKHHARATLLMPCLQQPSALTQCACKPEMSSKLGVVMDERIPWMHVVGEVGPYGAHAVVQTARHANGRAGHHVATCKKPAGHGEGVMDDRKGP